MLSCIKSNIVFLLTALLAVFFNIGNSFAEEYYEITVPLDSPEVNLIYPITDTYDPTSSSSGQIDFQDPLNIHNEVEYDPISGEYVFSAYIGDSLLYRNSSSMTLEEYIQYQAELNERNFWLDKMDEQTDSYRETSNVIPKLNIPGARKLFGSDFVEISPQGSAELSFGLNT